ncbi:ATP-binding protein [Candidatus Uabimicrobium amorphum]|uniref:ATPase n=1 Tax=Uabimicrobium amorphum TaxID=2596890 RepID=A0A5S9IHP5_UABAM|nr:ATP-binding protein [Candidatus Uabimicrobium amorphum]BBM81777.1 ATPase [Candidatus Uabimicrobium amorphum]
MQNVTTNFSYDAEDKRIGIISISGMIDLSNVGDFSQFLDKVLEVTCNILIFNLSGLTYMNSTGFGALTSRAMNEPKFKIIFCNLESNISEVFSMFGLDNVCDILPDLESAMEVAKTLVEDGTYDRESSIEEIEELEDESERELHVEEEQNTSQVTTEATNATANSAARMPTPTDGTPSTHVQFPTIKRCLSCGKKINFRTTGHYRCPRCKSILFINNEGTLNLIENPLSPSLPAVPENEGAPDEITIIFPSDTNYLSKIRDFIMSFTKATFDDQQRDSITMAVDEACSNAIEHAHHFDRNKKIHMSVLINEEFFSITITDSGVNTFSEHLVQPDDDQIKKSGRGMGLILMRRMMDEVNIRKTETNGTSISLVKYAKA